MARRIRSVRRFGLPLTSLPPAHFPFLLPCSRSPFYFLDCASTLFYCSLRLATCSTPQWRPRPRMYRYLCHNVLLSLLWSCALAAPPQALVRRQQNGGNTGQNTGIGPAIYVSEHSGSVCIERRLIQRAGPPRRSRRAVRRGRGDRMQQGLVETADAPRHRHNDDRTAARSDRGPARRPDTCWRPTDEYDAQTEAE